jgi:hypothetical protein
MFGASFSANWVFAETAVVFGLAELLSLASASP